jgi:DNA-binding NarL/FixJ family response regulator
MTTSVSTATASHSLGETWHPTAASANTICIGWVDVSCLTRECMSHAVSMAQRLFIIVPFESVRDCIKYSDRKIDLIVYHSHEADSVNARDIAALRDAFASTQLVVLSDATSLNPAVVRDILIKGASGFILTNQTGLQMVVSALGLVASGGTFVPKEFLMSERPTPSSGVEPRPPRSGQLTQREVEVLMLMKQGKPNKVIAHELKMSQSTVKVHARNLMRKMGATNRTQAAMNADERWLPETAPRAL